MKKPFSNGKRSVLSARIQRSAKWAVEYKGRESNSASGSNNSQCFSKNGGASSSENANRSRDPAGQAQAAATRPRAEAEAAVVEADKKASFRACPGVVGHVLISVLLNGGLRK